MFTPWALGRFHASGCSKIRTAHNKKGPGASRPDSVWGRTHRHRPTLPPTLSGNCDSQASRLLTPHSVQVGTQGPGGKAVCEATEGPGLMIIQDLEVNFQCDRTFMNSRDTTDQLRSIAVPTE